MIDRLLHNNLFLFFLALVLAIVIWAIAGGTADNTLPRQVSQTYTDVPYTIVNTDQDLAVLEADPGLVSVTLKGYPETLQGITPADFQIYVNLEDLEPGTHQVKVRGQAPPGASFVSFTPPMIEITLEEIISRQVSVSLSQEGIGQFTAQEVVIQPAEVFIRAPRRVLDQVNRVVALINLDNSPGVKTYMARLAALDAQGNELEVVSISPAVAEVNLSLELPGKEVTVSPVTTGSPAEGWVLSETVVSPRQVTARGPLEVIDPLEELTTEPADLSGAREELILELELIAPEGVQLSQQKVTVTFRFTKE